MKVLILSCSTGGGHNAAGNAMKQALEKLGHEAVMIDPYELKSEELADRVGTVYVKSVQRAPKAFGTVYGIGNVIRRIPFKSPVYYVNGRMAGRMRRYLEKEQFDAVLMPHLFPAEILTYMMRHQVPLPLTVFIATDYVCVPFTEETECDYYVIPAEDLKQEFARWGIPVEKMVSLGIPVRQECQEHRTRGQAKELLGLKEDCRYVILAGGSMGAGDLGGLVARLTDCIASKPEWRLVIICGSNRQLQETLTQTYQGHPQVQVIGYTSQMIAYMQAGELFLTKPGGLTTSEAASVGTPLVHISPIPGCEDLNLKYFRSRGMSEAICSLDEVSGVFERMQQPEVREAMIAEQHKRIHADAAEQICRFIEQETEKKK